MRILFACNGWQQSLRQNTAIGIRHVQAHYLARELRQQGHDIEYVKLGPRQMTLEQSIAYYNEQEIPEADHCLCFEASGFFHRTFEHCDEIVCRQPIRATRRVGLCPVLDRLKQSVSGAVATLKDTPNLVGPEDVTFFGLHYPEEITLMPQCIYLGVGADSEYIRPRQGKRLTVLLDHPHYTEGQPDDTSEILASLKGSECVITRFGQQGVEIIDDATCDCAQRYCPAGSHASAVAAHNAAHVFYTTHRESLGLSVIEAAMAGNLIVTKRGHIKAPLLRGLHCMRYDHTPPPWSEVVKHIDVVKARTVAMRYDRWTEMGWIIRNTFVHWRRASAL